MKTIIRLVAGICLWMAFLNPKASAGYLELYWPMNEGDIRFYTGPAGTNYTYFESDWYYGGYDARVYQLENNQYVHEGYQQYDYYDRFLISSRAWEGGGPPGPVMTQDVFSAGDTDSITNPMGEAVQFRLTGTRYWGMGNTYDPPIIYMEEGILANGGSITSHTTVSGQVDLTAKVTVTKAGTVKVPAGTYNDCRSISVTVAYGGRSGTVALWTLAPHVGIIKGAYSMGRSVVYQQLTSGTVGGVDVREYTSVAPLKISKQPAATKPFPGSTATFTVAATGSGSLSFQWLKNGEPVDGDGHVFGSTSASLVITPVSNSDAGSYSVIVSDKFGTIASGSAGLTVLADTVKPGVKINQPTANGRTANPHIAGTATDNAQVIEVNYWLTNINNGTVTVDSGQATLYGTNPAAVTWEAAPFYQPGTNILAVQSRDYSGNLSSVVSSAFFYKIPSFFALTKIGNGNGTFTGKAVFKGEVPPTNSTMLNVGQGYSLVAIADKNSFFSNWVSSVSGLITTNTIKFIMQEGLSLQANFVTNPFIKMAGNYDGLFMVGANATEETAGMMQNFKLGTRGEFSGKLLINGGTYSLSGIFNGSGHAQKTAPRPAAKGGPLNVELNILFDADHRTISGSVSGTNGGAWTADPLVLLASATKKNSSAFTLLVPPKTNSPLPSPGGYGYALVSERNSTLVISGALADGTAFNQTVPMNEVNGAPLYASLYKNTGLLLGWLNFDSGSFANGDAVPQGTITWIKKADRLSKIYTNGFTNVVPVLGSVWKKPAIGARLLPFTTNSPGKLDISGETDVTFNVAITSNKNAIVKVTGTPTNSFDGSLDPKTGLMKVTFGNGQGKKTTVGQGAVLQAYTNAAGFYLGTNQSGAILLERN